MPSVKIARFFYILYIVINKYLCIVNIHVRYYFSLLINDYALSVKIGCIFCLSHFKPFLATSF